MNSDLVLKTDAVTRLRSLLKEGPVDAPFICAHLNISQPTFSRLWKTAGVDVVRFGLARATQYGITRPIGNMGSVLPLFHVKENGDVVPFGELRTLQRDWNVLIPADGSSPEVVLGLPYFLQDLRPQGFLGRLVPRKYSDLQLPESVQDWSDDDTLRYLAQRGEDVPGNIIVGNESYRRYLTRHASGDLDVILESTRPTVYADLAMRANQGDVPGSSAGGEQPKFTSAVLRDDGNVEQVIVKFSPVLSTDSSKRWADLLIAEHLAMETLLMHGIPACKSNIVITEERTYLEATRFDRVGVHGRAPIVSLTGMDCLLTALDKNWSFSGTLLHDKGWISIADLDTIRLLDVYGALIGNSDRHPGNLSLSWDGDGNFALAPIYDMLPMMYQPNRQGEIIERHFHLSVLDNLDLRYLSQAQVIAVDFWINVMSDARISDDFKTVAERHVAIIRTAVPTAFPTKTKSVDYDQQP